MTIATLGDPNFLQRLGRRLGLLHDSDGAPTPGGPKRSRYGVYVSPRVDQDIDELRRRLAALERDAR